jgi:ribosomal protein S18 acetylase RimI-like enzyme
MEKDYIIRYAVAADAAKIADISRKTFNETFGFLNKKENMDLFMRTQFSKEVLMQEVYDAANIYIVAEENGELLGYVKLKTNSTKEELKGKLAIEIARIYVLNACLGSGIGPALMRKCIFTAKDMKCDTIWLGVWEKNPRAIAFYEKWGFEKFSEHDFTLGQDVQKDWLMKKELN